MKFIITALSVIFFLGGCATHHEGNHYDRANKASQKALDQLDRD